MTKPEDLMVLLLSGRAHVGRLCDAENASCKSSGIVGINNVRLSEPHCSLLLVALLIFCSCFAGLLPLFLLLGCCWCAAGLLLGCCWFAALVCCFCSLMVSAGLLLVCCGSAGVPQCCLFGSMLAGRFGLCPCRLWPQYVHTRSYTASSYLYFVNCPLPLTPSHLITRTCILVYNYQLAFVDPFSSSCLVPQYGPMQDYSRSRIQKADQGHAWSSARRSAW